jgi:hypothetical protein
MTWIGAPALGVGEVLQRGEQRGGVGEQVVGAAALVHGGGAGEQRLDVDAGERGGQQADGGQHAEAAADAGRHGSVAMPSSSAMRRSTPRSGSVVKMR